jgi:hypothetical protein
VTAPDNTPCTDLGKCRGGTCRPAPVCWPADAPCDFFEPTNNHCCSNSCFFLDVCDRSLGGGTCYSDRDCSGSVTCKADFTCQGTCSTGADACQSGSAPCGNGGQCYRPVGGGESRCGLPTSTSSCGCTSHQQCATTYGPGVFCVQITGAACTGCAAGTFCAVPR